MVCVPSFAKINLGLKIGPARPDGFHELRTVYQTLALHDFIRVDVVPGSGIEICCDDARVPLDRSNTCYKIAERVLAAMARTDHPAHRGEQQVSRLDRRGDLARDDNQETENTFDTPEAVTFQQHHASQPDKHSHVSQQRVVIEIDKRLPVQGGMGAASSNAVATMLAMERVLGVELALEHKLGIAAEVGSDLPLFLIGGTVLGVGRGEEVYALPDFPRTNVVVVTPPIGVSTPKAFARWDELKPASPEPSEGDGLTGLRSARTINGSSESVLDCLAERIPQVLAEAGPASGVPAWSGDRAETPLLDLVRAGIENDFERVVFPEYPELREVKELLLRQGARYASLSGSGSTIYGLFDSDVQATGAAQGLSAAGHRAIATTTLTRQEYWKAVRGD